MYVATEWKKRRIQHKCSVICLKDLLYAGILVYVYMLLSHKEQENSISNIILRHK